MAWYDGGAISIFASLHVWDFMEWICLFSAVECDGGMDGFGTRAARGHQISLPSDLVDPFSKIRGYVVHECSNAMAAGET